MNGKEFIGGLVVLGCFILLPISWYMHQDGPITTALIALIGLTAGTIIGFKFGQKQL